MTGERQARRRYRAGNDQPLVRNIGPQPTQKHEEKQIEEYNINYDYYLDKVNKEIENFIPSVNQLSLF